MSGDVRFLAMPSSAERLSTALADRYRIERELGAGGMATVYLAEDLKHDRKVAIKVLKPELAAVLGAERFVVEIKTTAALSHPHILPLFDSGTADGFLFYVMPFIKGETIREKLNRETQFGVDEAVRIAREVADALDYAHRNGVIHRDIKPENILLHDGRAMVMDFGIALAVSAAAGGRMTETGLSLGTPHYMSPEQATAEKEITGRSDIYSLATVLYEMLAGVPPHEGGSAQQTIMRILTDTPRPVTELRKAVPPNVAEALAKALEKLPADRFETAKAFGEALVMPGFRHGVTGYAGIALAARRVPGARAWMPWGVAAMLAVVAVAGWMRRDDPQSVARLDVSTGPIVPGPREIVLSRDGSLMAVAGRVGDELAIHVRRIDGDVAFRKVAGTEDGIMPDFSPDGRWIVFRRNTTRELVKIPVSGGSAVTLVSGMDPYSPHWGTDDGIVFGSPGGNFRISPAGGKPERLRQVRGRAPFMLADGSGILFSGSGDLALYDFASDTTYPLGLRGAHPILADNTLLFVNEAGALAAAGFDRRAPRVVGAPVVVADRVGGSSDTRGYSVSRNGTLVLYDAAPSATFIVESGNHLVVVTPRGPADTLRLPAGRVFAPRISPDGRKIAYETFVAGRQDSSRLNAVDLVTGTVALLRMSEFVGAVWSPDGRKILFSGTGVPEGTESDLWVKDVVNNGPETQLTRLPGNQWPTAWPRENLVLFGSEQTGAGIDAYRWDPTGQEPPRPYLNGPWNEDQLAVSPDGRLAAFVSEEHGTPEVYVREFPVPQNKWRLTTGYSGAPRWSRDGRYLWWARGSGGSGIDTVYRARVERAPTVRFGTPEVMYAADIDGIQNWDLHPDGDRLVVVVPKSGGAQQGASSTTATLRYLVTLNWFEELRRQLGAQRQ